MAKLYADIILPLALQSTYTYSVENKCVDSIAVGSRVRVELGRSKQYTGIVYALHFHKPDHKRIKAVLELIDDTPVLSPGDLRLWSWISTYYMCSIGEVMRAALPSLFLYPEKGLYTKKTRKYVSLPREQTEKEINSILNKLEKKAAQYRIMIKWLELTGYPDDHWGDIEKIDLLKESGASAASLNSLVKSGILEIKESEVSRFSNQLIHRKVNLVLSTAQDKVFNQIKEDFKQKEIVLLHGVTSSGKTEIYIKLMWEYLHYSKKVLYLLPEIALTTQIINRLRGHFGERIGIFHSGLSEAEKAEVYSRFTGSSRLGTYDILLGVRSSVFMPSKDIGLIIIDEEHDGSFKQHDPAPRYNARDTAIMKAHFEGAKVLLGSATPSVETMYNAREGRYGYVEINERFGKIRLPQILLSDTKEAWRKKMMTSHFSPQLISSIDEALQKKEQVVLFRNRRGFAHFIICADCGWTPVCNDCSVNMAYHKTINRLSCHYCGSSELVPVRCANCKSTNLRMKGFGTEKIEDEISILFPDAKIDRMDLDTTRKKGSVDRIIKNLENQKTDILIGTQMISKGLDFENLTLVGILNIDAMLFYPDFRAYERCYQLASQVSGRAGRRQTQGKVLIQTSDPQHPVMKQILNHDYGAMYKTQISERKEFYYPPFCRLIRIYFKHREKKVNDSASEQFVRLLRSSLDEKILGPEIPYLSRIQNLYVRSVLVKVDKSSKQSRVRSIIYKMGDTIMKNSAYKGIRIYYDVDPN